MHILLWSSLFCAHDNSLHLLKFNIGSVAEQEPIFLQRNQVACRYSWSAVHWSCGLPSLL